MFAIKEGSDNFNTFLSLIGKKTLLKGYKGMRNTKISPSPPLTLPLLGFAGGLDTSDKERNGKYSVINTFKKHNIMFHVSTLLPFDHHDAQQVGEKSFFFLFFFFLIIFFYFVLGPTKTSRL